MSIAVTSAPFVPATDTIPVNQKTTKENPTSTAVQDTVHLSARTQASLSAAQAALQEAVETQAQTSKEPGTGDLEAARLLARETAH